MWFTNVLVFEYEWDQTQPDLATLLAEERLKPCPPHARFVHGWLPAIGDQLVHEVAGCALICLGKEERVLPRSVINRLLQERVQAITLQTGKNVKRNERAQMAEDLEFELLPKAFCVQKKLTAVFDTLSNRLIINTSSNNQATPMLALLRKSIPGIKLTPIACTENLAVRFAHWISNPALLPSTLQLANDCLLFSLDDEKKRFTCKGCELTAEEIVALLSQGLAAAEISLIWNERIQFTLTDDLVFKRLKCLDYLVDEFQAIQDLDEEYQQQDAALTLLAGELRAFTADVFKALVEVDSVAKIFLG